MGNLLSVVKNATLMEGFAGMNSDMSLECEFCLHLWDFGFVLSPRSTTALPVSSLFPVWRQHVLVIWSSSEQLLWPAV